VTSAASAPAARPADSSSEVAALRAELDELRRRFNALVELLGESL